MTKLPEAGASRNIVRRRPIFQQHANCVPVQCLNVLPDVVEQTRDPNKNQRLQQ